MSKISFFLGIFLVTLSQPAILLAETTTSSQPLLIAANEENTLEQQVLEEINRARTNPIAYAEWLETIKQYYDNNNLKFPEEEIITTQEGVKAVDEAISFLRSLSPLTPLTSSENLNIIAQRILNSQSNLSALQTNQTRESTTSSFDNNLSYGKTAQVIVMQLIVDDGVATRSSRNKIFQSDLQNNGVACTANTDEQNICVITYAPNSSQPSTPEDNEVAIKPDNTVGFTPILQKQGALETGDNIMPSDGSLYDFYPIEGRAGQSLTVALESQDFDTFLAVVDEDNNIIQQNDDIDQQNSNSTLTVTLPKDGRYYVIVNSYDPQGRGSYILNVEDKK